MPQCNLQGRQVRYSRKVKELTKPIAATPAAEPIELKLPPIPLSILSEKRNIIRMYPYPVQEHLYLEFIEIPREIKILNTMGSTKLELSNIAPPPPVI